MIDYNNIAIVIVNFNGYNDTMECVESIIQNCTLEKEIIIVDNNSHDNDVINLKKTKNKYRYTLILNEKNEGFAKANNKGIKYALSKGYKSILLLNNDTIITKDSLEKMLEVLWSNEDIGITSCTTLYYDNKDLIWFDGGNINWEKFLSTHENMKKRYSKTKEISDVEFISGCCMMIKSQVFQQVGLLPIEYFMYFEDVDFCVAVKEYGYRMVVCKESVIYHKVSSASGGEDSPFTIEWCNRNRIIFMNKYKAKSKNKVKFLGSIMFFCSGRIIRTLQYLLRNDKKRAYAVIKGTLRGFKDTRYFKKEMVN